MKALDFEGSFQGGAGHTNKQDDLSVWREIERSSHTCSCRAVIRDGLYPALPVVCLPAPV